MPTDTHEKVNNSSRRTVPQLLREFNRIETPIVPQFNTEKLRCVTSDVVTCDTHEYRKDKLKRKRKMSAESRRRNRR